MECPKCGYVLAPFDKTCPRCKAMGTQSGRRPAQASPGKPSPSIGECRSGETTIHPTGDLSGATRSTHSTATNGDSHQQLGTASEDISRLYQAEENTVTGTGIVDLLATGAVVLLAFLCLPVCAMVGIRNPDTIMVLVVITGLLATLSTAVVRKATATNMTVALMNDQYGSVLAAVWWVGTIISCLTVGVNLEDGNGTWFYCLALTISSFLAIKWTRGGE